MFDLILQTRNKYLREASAAHRALTDKYIYIFLLEYSVSPLVIYLHFYIFYLSLAICSSNVNLCVRCACARSVSAVHACRVLCTDFKYNSLVCTCAIYGNYDDWLFVWRAKFISNCLMQNENSTTTKIRELLVEFTWQKINYYESLPLS